MSVRVGPATGGGPVPEDRGQAIKRIVAAREQQSTAPAQQSAPAASQAAPASELSKPAGPPPEHLIEIERRERALDAMKHELAMRDAEIGRYKSLDEDGKDYRKLLARYGHSIDDVVAGYLSDDKPAPQTSAQSLTANKPELPQEYLSRIEQIEKRYAQEDEQRKRAARIEELRKLTPPDNEDFELLNTMGWHEGVLQNEVERIEHEQKRQVGPQEMSHLLREFEQLSRKNVESQVGQLAKTKWGRTLLSSLLSEAKQPASQPVEAPAPIPQSQPDDWAQGRAFRLQRDRASLREELKRKALERWK